MKRSRVNEILIQSDAFIRSFGYLRPPFAYWSPQRMREAKDSLVVRRGLGWDIADFGQGKFDALGLFLFTVRNGDLAHLQRGKGMLYAEKIMISRKDQHCPMHRHHTKCEDIILRGGGKLALKLYASAQDGGIDQEQEVCLLVDGQERKLSAGGMLRLEPGESVTLFPGIWHAFWAEEADCLIGEVSTVNDDQNDNVFDTPINRFSEIEEDEAPLQLLVSDYSRL